MSFTSPFSNPNRDRDPFDDAGDWAEPFPRKINRREEFIKLTDSSDVEVVETTKPRGLPPKPNRTQNIGQTGQDQNRYSDYPDVQALIKRKDLNGKPRAVSLGREPPKQPVFVRKPGPHSSQVELGFLEISNEFQRQQISKIDEITYSSPEQDNPASTAIPASVKFIAKDFIEEIADYKENGYREDREMDIKLRTDPLMSLVSQGLAYKIGNDIRCYSDREIGGVCYLEIPEPGNFPASVIRQRASTPVVIVQGRSVNGFQDSGGEGEPLISGILLESKDKKKLRFGFYKDMGTIKHLLTNRTAHDCDYYIRNDGNLSDQQKCERLMRILAEGFQIDDQKIRECSKMNSVASEPLALQKQSRESLLPLFSFLQGANEEPFESQQPTDPQTTALVSKVAGYLKLNDWQATAVFRSIHCDSFHLIHGPPGTGKTDTLVSVILALAAQKKQILVTAATNACVDNLMVRFMEYHQHINQKQTTGGAHTKNHSENLHLVPIDKIVHVGNILKASVTRFSRLNWAYRRSPKGDRLEQLHDSEMKEKVRNAQIVFATHSKCFDHRLLTAIGADSRNPSDARFFDYVIVDEASQSGFSFGLMAIMMGKKFVMGGDHCQLPPFHRFGCAKQPSLFERIMNHNKRNNICRDISTMLAIQFRMNELISLSSSIYFYKGWLRAAVKNKKILLKDIVDQKNTGTYLSKYVPLVWADHQGYETSSDNRCNHGMTNMTEVEVLLYLLWDLLKNLKVAPKNISIITSYSRQKAILIDLFGQLEKNHNSTYSQIEVSTVDSFQGRENEIVIYSAVRANEAREIGFLRDNRRLNVAVTRAKRMLIVVGNTRYLLEEDKILSKIRKVTEKYGQILQFSKDTPDHTLYFKQTNQPLQCPYNWPDYAKEFMSEEMIHNLPADGEFGGRVPKIPTVVVDRMDDADIIDDPSKVKITGVRVSDIRKLLGPEQPTDQETSVASPNITSPAKTPTQSPMKDDSHRADHESLVSFSQVSVIGPEEEEPEFQPFLPKKTGQTSLWKRGESSDVRVINNPGPLLRNYSDECWVPLALDFFKHRYHEDEVEDSNKAKKVDVSEIFIDDASTVKSKPFMIDLECTDYDDEEQNKIRKHLKQKQGAVHAVKTANAISDLSFTTKHPGRLSPRSQFVPNILVPGETSKRAQKKRNSTHLPSKRTQSADDARIPPFNLNPPTALGPEERKRIVPLKDRSDDYLEKLLRLDGITLSPERSKPAELPQLPTADQVAPIAEPEPPGEASDLIEIKEFSKPLLKQKPTLLGNLPRPAKSSALQNLARRLKKSIQSPKSDQTSSTIETNDRPFIIRIPTETISKKAYLLLLADCKSPVQSHVRAERGRRLKSPTSTHLSSPSKAVSTSLRSRRQHHAIPFAEVVQATRKPPKPRPSVSKPSHQQHQRADGRVCESRQVRADRPVEQKSDGVLCRGAKTGSVGLRPRAAGPHKRPRLVVDDDHHQWLEGREGRGLLGVRGRLQDELEQSSEDLIVKPAKHIPRREVINEIDRRFSGRRIPEDFDETYLDERGDDDVRLQTLETELRITDGPRPCTGSQVEGGRRSAKFLTNVFGVSSTTGTKLSGPTKEKPLRERQNLKKGDDQENSIARKSVIVLSGSSEKPNPVQECSIGSPNQKDNEANPEDATPLIYLPSADKLSRRVERRLGKRTTIESELQIRLDRQQDSIMISKKMQPQASRQMHQPLVRDEYRTQTSRPGLLPFSPQKQHLESRRIPANNSFKSRSKAVINSPSRVERMLITKSGLPSRRSVRSISRENLLGKRSQQSIGATQIKLLSDAKGPSHRKVAIPGSSKDFTRQSHQRLIAEPKSISRKLRSKTRLERFPIVPDPEVPERSSGMVRRSHNTTEEQGRKPATSTLSQRRRL